MTRRTQHLATGFDEILATAIKVTQEAGATSFELGYTATERLLRPDEQPLPTEPVRWTASATFAGPLGERTATGTAVSRPGQCDHGRAISYAVVRMLEAGGANTIVLDASDHTTEPPR